MLQMFLSLIAKIRALFVVATPTNKAAPKAGTEPTIVAMDFTAPPSNKPSAFERSLTEVLRWEGGRVDDPRDPGGRTAYGVIQRVYDKWRASRGLPPRDVWLIDPKERETIYRERYWNVMFCDDYHPAVAFAVFNFCVNAGARQATLDAQRVVGVTADGVLGPRTRAALAKVDPKTFVQLYAERQRVFYPKLKTYHYFGKGWMRRVDGTAKFAMSLI